MAVARLLGIEGGFVDSPYDHGGATKYGISLRFLKAEGAIDANHDGLADFDLDMDGDIDGADVRLLTVSQAVALFHRCFWERLGCERFVEPVGEMLFDQGVNDGILASKKLLQRAINACAVHIPGVPRLALDGAIGPASLSALTVVLSHPALGMVALCQAFRDAAAARYRAIAAADPRQRKNLAGWLARAEHLGRDR